MLTDEQARSFAEQGWVVLEGLVPPGVVDELDGEVARLVEESPPPHERVGPHFYWRTTAESPVLFRPLSGPGGILAIAAELSGGDGLVLAFDQAQVALNIPPYAHRPGRPHIDGYAAGQETPGTFTMLAGLLLTDQAGDNGGNLWVWPGTHRTHGRYFGSRGPEAFAAAGGYPDIDLPAPVQVHGRRGDVLLAHYLLGHNIGGNYESDRTRRVVYWRLQAPGHADRWAQCLADPWLEYPAVRALPRSTPWPG